MSTHLIRLELDKTNLREYRLLNPKIQDLPYRVHAALMALFEDVGPRPWYVTRSDLRQTIPVVGYGPLSAEGLSERIDLVDPEIFGLLVDGTLKSREVPVLRAKRMIRFSVKVQPSVHTKSRRDVDVYLVKNQGVDRESVYVGWLQKRLVGATIQTACLTRSSLTTRVFQPNGKVIEHNFPEAHIEGILSVEDQNSFAKTLARGIGRGRGFGYGMLRIAAA